jgi:hypothetical protein
MLLILCAECRTAGQSPDLLARGNRHADETCAGPGKIGFLRSPLWPRSPCRRSNGPVALNAVRYNTWRGCLLSALRQRQCPSLPSSELPRTCAELDGHPPVPLSRLPRSVLANRRPDMGWEAFIAASAFAPLKIVLLCCKKASISSVLYGALPVLPK